MADKLRTTYPVEVVFTPGEQPSAEKLTAVSTQAKTGMRIIENAIGDLWGTGGDPNFKGLEIPSLGRVVGQNSYLNPALFSLQTTLTGATRGPFYYIERLDEEFAGKTTGYLTFKPHYNSNYTGETGFDGYGFIISDGTDVLLDMSAGDPANSQMHQEGLIGNIGDNGSIDTNKYFVDLGTGRFRFPEPFVSGTLKYIGYWVHPDDWALGDIDGQDIVPGVIPDLRSQPSMLHIERQVANPDVYHIKIPQRTPLQADVYDMEQKIPVPCQANGVNLNDESVGLAEAGFSDAEAPRIWNTSDTHVSTDPSFHRYQIPLFTAMAQGEQMKEGSIKLIDRVSKGVVHGLVFKKLDEGTIEVTDSLKFLESLYDNVAGNPATLYGTFQLITGGPSLSKSVAILRNALFNHTHDGGFQENTIDHSVFKNSSPAKNRDDMVWTASNFNQPDDHIQYLHRENSVGGVYRDPNRNAFLDDLIIAQDTLDSATGLYIGDLTTHGSNNIYFGIDAGDSPQIGVTAPQLTGTLWAIPVSNPDYSVIDFSNLFVVDANDDRIEDPGRTLRIESGNNSSIIMDGLLTTINLPYRYLNFDSTPGAGTIEAEDYYDLITPKLLITKPFGPTIVKLKGSPSVTGYKHGFGSGGGNAILHLTGHEDNTTHNCGRLWWDGRNEKLKLQWFSNSPVSFEGNYGFDGAGPTGDIDTSGWPSYTTQPTALEIWKKYTGLQSLIASSNPNNSQLYDDLTPVTNSDIGSASYGDVTGQLLGLAELEKNTVRSEGPIQTKSLFIEYRLDEDSGFTDYSTTTLNQGNSGELLAAKVWYYLSLKIEDNIAPGNRSWSEPGLIGTSVKEETGTGSTISVSCKVPANIYEYAIFRKVQIMNTSDPFQYRVFRGRTFRSEEERRDHFTSVAPAEYKTIEFEDWTNYDENLHDDGLYQSKWSTTNQKGLIPFFAGEVKWNTQMVLNSEENATNNLLLLGNFPPEIITTQNETDHLGATSSFELGKKFHITEGGDLFLAGKLKTLGSIENLNASGVLKARELGLREQKFEGLAKIHDGNNLGAAIANSGKWHSYKASIKSIKQEAIVTPIQFSVGNGVDKLLLRDEVGNAIDGTSIPLTLPNSTNGDGSLQDRFYLGFHPFSGVAGMNNTSPLNLRCPSLREVTASLNLDANLEPGSDWKAPIAARRESGISDYYGDILTVIADFGQATTETGAPLVSLGACEGLSHKKILNVTPSQHFYTGPYSHFDHHMSANYKYKVSSYFDFIGWEVSPIRYFELSEDDGVAEQTTLNMNQAHPWKFSSNQFLKLHFRCTHQDRHRTSTTSEGSTTNYDYDIFSLGGQNGGTAGPNGSKRLGLDWKIPDPNNPGQFIDSDSIPSYILGQLKFKVTYIEAGEYNETVGGGSWLPNVGDIF